MNDPRDFFRHLTARELAALKSALLPTERLYWGTRPIPMFWQHDTVVALVIGGVLLTFASLFLWGTFRAAEPAVFLGIVIVSGLLGLAVFSWPFRRWQRLRHSFYLVTTQRALIVARSWGKWGTRAFPLNDYILRWRRVRKDAQGDLVFHDGDERSSSRVGFLCLPDAQLAERKMNEAMALRGEKMGSGGAPPAS